MQKKNFIHKNESFTCSNCGKHVEKGDGFIRNKPVVAENTNSRIDSEIIKISKTCLDNSIKILQKNRVLMDKLVDILINTETIGKEIFTKTTSDLLKV